MSKKIRRTIRAVDDAVIGRAVLEHMIYHKLVYDIRPDTPIDDVFVVNASEQVGQLIKQMLNPFELEKLLPPPTEADDGSE